MVDQKMSNENSDRSRRYRGIITSEQIVEDTKKDLDYIFDPKRNCWVTRLGDWIKPFDKMKAEMESVGFAYDPNSDSWKRKRDL